MTTKSVSDNLYARTVSKIKYYNTTEDESVGQIDFSYRIVVEFLFVSSAGTDKPADNNAEWRKKE